MIGSSPMNCERIIKQEQLLTARFCVGFILRRRRLIYVSKIIWNMVTVVQ
jgi:hypothetical protein